MDPDHEKAKLAIGKMENATDAFVERARQHAGIDLSELIDPDGMAVASLVDGEASAGAALLAQPMDLLLFETWLLGHLGDHDGFDLDVNTHRDIFFRLGSWIGHIMQARHGGSWLLVGDDPRAWRFGFSKIMLEISPHAFAEKLLQSGQGLAARMLGEIERIREQHEQAAEEQGGKAEDKFSPQHYARLHTVPLAQWMVLDMNTLRHHWDQVPVSELIEQLTNAAKNLPEQNKPIIDKMITETKKLDADRPALEQVNDRGLYEAVAQVLALKRITPPVAVDVLEKLVLPALHVGEPKKFPPLDEDDVAQLKNGTDLFSLYLEVVPYAQRASEDGFLACFAQDELGTPYADQENLQVGNGDWLLVNPERLRKLFSKFDPKGLARTFDRFVKYVEKNPDVPRVRNTGTDLVQTAVKVLTDLRTCVRNVAPGCALVFRLLPPPP